MRKAIKRLTLHNFQSHADTTLELSPGVNIIVGPSDVGKTAIIRALRWVYYNQPRGSNFLRMGSSDCWVEVETEDGVRVRRWRSENQKRNCYILEVPGQEPLVLERIGSSVPEEVRAALGVSELVLDQDVMLEINIAQQLEGPFLLGNSPSTRAKAIGRLGDAHVLDAAQREIQKDLRAAASRADRLRGELENEERELARFFYLEDWSQRLQELDRLFSRLSGLRRDLGQLEQLYSRYQEAKREKRRIEEVLSELQDLGGAENGLEEARRLGQTLREATTLRIRHQESSLELERQQAVLAATGDVDQAENTLADLKLGAAHQQVLQDLSTRLAQNKNALHLVEERLSATRGLEDGARAQERCQNLLSSLLRLEDLHNQNLLKHDLHARFTARAESTSGLSQAESLISRLNQLRQQGVEASSLLREVKTLGARREERQGRLAAAQKEIGRLAGYQESERVLERLRELDGSLNGMQEAMKLYTANREQYQHWEARWRELGQYYQHTTREYIGILKEMGRCPICQGSLDDEHLQQLQRQLEGDWVNEQ